MDCQNRLNNIKSWHILFIFLGLSILFYHQALINFFVSDDFHWLVIARDFHPSWHIFLTNYEGQTYGGSYNPLLVFIFKFFYSLFDLRYFGYHLVSLLLHGVNSWLVYLLAKHTFSWTKIKDKKPWAILVGLLFLIWPIQVEIVSWVAAWPHLWMTLFYFLALLKYFDFRKNSKKINLFLSFLFFTVALLIKETAISLPFVIMMLEIYFYSIKEKNKSIPAYTYLTGYFVLLISFLVVRYIAIGLLFGYYGSHSLNLAAGDWAGNLAVYLGDMVTFGFIRPLMYKAIYYYLAPIVIILFSFLALYFFVLLIKKQWLQFVLFAGFLFMLSPFLITGLHHTTFAGERYMYLSASFFLMILVYLLAVLKFSLSIKKIILILFLILSSSIIYYKSIIWQAAGDLSRQIVDSYKYIHSPQTNFYLSVGLPDNLSGAEVFRNNLGQALEIYYKDKAPEILPTYAYVVVNKENKNKHLLNWRRDNLGWFAESVDGSFVVTGITSIEVNDVYWELWNYNYQNYMANTIRFIPNSDMRKRIENSEVGIITVDEGRLRLLK
ncbi:glucosyltransferase domain-containing protein [Patescibacteria group bacterium]|nr:glucosyltransferase domain-containing protein [Patescibacteria group bacterium]